LNEIEATKKNKHNLPKEYRDFFEKNFFLDAYMPPKHALYSGSSFVDTRKIENLRVR
jgi:hypothetical protein